MLGRWEATLAKCAPPAATKRHNLKKVSPSTSTAPQDAGAASISQQSAALLTLGCIQSHVEQAAPRQLFGGGALGVGQPCRQQLVQAALTAVLHDEAGRVAAGSQVLAHCGRPSGGAWGRSMVGRGAGAWCQSRWGWQLPLHWPKDSSVHGQPLCSTLLSTTNSFSMPERAHRWGGAAWP